MIIEILLLAVSIWLSRKVIKSIWNNKQVIGCFFLSILLLLLVAQTIVYLFSLINESPKEYPYVEILLISLFLLFVRTKHFRTLIELVLGLGYAFLFFKVLKLTFFSMEAESGYILTASSWFILALLSVLASKLLNFDDDFTPSSIIFILLGGISIFFSLMIIVRTIGYLLITLLVFLWPII